MSALLLIWLGWAAFVAPPPEAREAVVVETIRVSATGYTCAYHPANRMATTPGMCEYLANGSRDVFSRGMACPRHWMGRTFDVEGVGVLTCDDRGAFDVWHGLPHIDIRFDTWEAARAWGVRTITIREVRLE